MLRRVYPFVAAAGALCAIAAATTKPNIIFMMADDLGWDDITVGDKSSRKSRFVHNTPTLSSLAFRGVRLMKHYTEPWCLPSRSALLTGMSPARYAVNFVNIQADKASMLLKTVGVESYPHGLASRLRDEAGYSTAWVGKWHAVGDGPVSFGFEHGFGDLKGSIDDYFNPHLCYHFNASVAATNRSLMRRNEPEGPLKTHDVRLNKWWSKAPIPIKTAQHNCVNGYATALEAAEATRIILNRKFWSNADIDEFYEDEDVNASSAIESTKKTPKPRKPLFLYIAWHAPHAPYQETPFAYLYKKKYPTVSRSIHNRMGMISALDHYVKDVLNAVLKREAYRSTLIVFCSDNGAPGMSYLPETATPPPDSLHVRNLRTKKLIRKKVSTLSDVTRARHEKKLPSPYDFYPTNAPFKGFKGSLFEGGIRTFAFAVWPGVLPGNKLVHAPLHISDWFPTFFAVAGLTSTATTRRLPWKFNLDSERETRNIVDGTFNGKALDGLNAWPTIRGQCEGINETSMSIECRERPIYISSLIPCTRALSLDNSAKDLHGTLALTRGALITRDGLSKFMIDVDSPTAWQDMDKTKKIGKSESGLLIKSNCRALRKSSGEWTKEIPLRWSKWFRLGTSEKYATNKTKYAGRAEEEIDLSSRALTCIKLHSENAVLLDALFSSSYNKVRSSHTAMSTKAKTIGKQYRKLAYCLQFVEILLLYLELEESQKVDFRDVLIRQAFPRGVLQLKTSESL